LVVLEIVVVDEPLQQRITHSWLIPQEYNDKKIQPDRILNNNLKDFIIVGLIYYFCGFSYFNPFIKTKPWNHYFGIFRRDNQRTILNNQSEIIFIFNYLQAYFFNNKGKISSIYSISPFNVFHRKFSEKIRKNRIPIILQLR